jgi:7-cyano-7-deazaguanine reductase|tara:strand:+ start:1679 stop:2125 length:447 start_codon:yes stop_codon:yes gene_type:complete
MKKLNQLGKKSKILSDPKKVILDTVENPNKKLKYVVRLSSPEFTSICPLTSQPDFGNIIIDYIPSKLIVESKSFKLFLHSFRNHGAFHEECTLMIANKVINAVSPAWLRIGGFWNPRGGIPIDIFYQTGKKPNDIWLEDYQIRNYKGR